MKLRNKKTREINIVEVDEDYFKIYKDDGEFVCIVTLKELNEGWEDYEEPKKYWFIDYDGGILCGESDNSSAEKMMISMGNRFETIEEAEKAVEKLKAWKRLKDKGFKFSKDWVYRYDQPKVENHTYFEFVAICEDGIRFDDLDLLFGGEE